MSISNNLTEASAAQAPMTGPIKMASLPARQRKGPPPHPGVIIADLLDDNGVSLRKAAKAIGLSPTGLEKIVNGKGGVTASTAVRLAAYLSAERSAELWLDLQRDYDLWHARAKLASALKKIKPISV